MYTFAIRPSLVRAAAQEQAAHDAYKAFMGASPVPKGRCPRRVPVIPKVSHGSTTVPVSATGAGPRTFEEPRRGSTRGAESHRVARMNVYTGRTRHTGARGNTREQRDARGREGGSKNNESCEYMEMHDMHDDA